MPLSLTARLLRAARHAYDITLAGVLADTDDSTPIGFVGEVDCFVRGVGQIDAALVGEAADAIIVAFRGTLPPDSPNHGQAILDWASDCDALPIIDPGGLPGHVHQGFLNAVNDLWPDVRRVLAARNAASPTKPIYFTGHSKGGPLANLAALRLHLDPGIPAATPILVATFAGARPGDATFAATYDAQLPHTARYEYADDIVPHLPPSDEFVAMFRNIPQFSATLENLTRGYVSVGELHFIDWDGNLVGDTPLLRFDRFAHLARLMTTFGFATIVADHSIAPGSGYARAIDG